MSIFKQNKSKKHDFHKIWKSDGGGIKKKY